MNNSVTPQKKDSSEVTIMHECNFCGKSFKNGKALGGHRRSHFQAAKVKSLLSNNDKKKSVFDDDGSCNNGDNGKKHTCYLCKKGFRSSHSLFGHMRTHPNRPWTGVRPPIHSHHDNSEHGSSGFEDDYDDDDEYDEVVVASTIDISKSSSLPRWQKTGKRGRKSTSVYDAAENLVLMSLRDDNFLAVMSMVVEPKFHQSSIIPCNGKNVEEASTSRKHVAKKIKFYVSDSLSEFTSERRILVNMNSEEEIKKDYGSMNIEDAIQDHVDNLDERKKKVMKLLVKNLKGPNSESETQKKVNGYVCDICCKSFPTFQGLGGHRSIHNKEKNNVINMAESKSSDYAVADEDATMRGLVMEATIDASSSQCLGPKILDFDLNMLPDMYE